ncbi:EAL domain-containing protein [Thalassotalea psychrophila]|uniref:EAL domain-containing protein n=1 Tax=Thalassotalea psychrophila TaxID=3065647 RepID=A0ABY9TP94_9GAMM|nr:EAL domain-containing protein [Colwelliaceae bacterium SQ149]
MKNVSIKYIANWVCCLVLFFINPVFASNFSHLQRFNGVDGLSQQNITSLVKGNQGNIWIGTDDGLNIYDGYNFYQLSGPNAKFTDYRIAKMFQQNNNDMWISLFDGGLYKYTPDEQRYQLIYEPSELNKSNGTIIDIHQDHTGNMWFASSNSLFKYSIDKQQLIEQINISHLSDAEHRIFDINIHHEQIYIATKIGLFVYQPKIQKLNKLPFPVANKSHSVSNFFTTEILNHILYLGTDDGVLSVPLSAIENYLDQTTDQLHYQLEISDLNVWHLLTQDNQLYVSSHNGLYQYDIYKQKLNKLTAFSDVYPQIKNNRISSLIIDEENIWLGSKYSGLFKWPLKQLNFSNIIVDKSKTNSLSSNNIWALEQDPNNDKILWAATENGLNAINVDTLAVTPYLVNNNKQETISKSYIYDMDFDSHGQLWLHTTDGLTLFDTINKTQKSLNSKQQKLGLLMKRNLYKNFFHQDTFWFIKESTLYSANTNNGEITEYPEITGQLPLESINRLIGFLPKTNTLMLGSNDTLWTFDTVSKRVTKLFTNPYIEDNRQALIDSFAIKNNTLWLSYYSAGLVAISLENMAITYNSFDESSSIKHSYGVMFDKNINPWFASHQGIHNLNLANQTLHSYSKNDGLVSDEFNANAHARLKNGNFAYGSVNGISIINTSMLLKQTTLDKGLTINLSNVEIMSAPKPFVLLNKPTDLAFNYDDIGIKLNFSHSQALTSPFLTFEYKFVNSKKDFISMEGNSISFSSLPSGNNQLVVRLVNTFQHKTLATFTLPIKVSYSPWLSPISISLYTLILIFISLVYYRHRRVLHEQLLAAHQQVKQRENRLQIALKNTKSGVWEWQLANNSMIANRYHDELGLQHLYKGMSFDEHLLLIHEQDKQKYKNHWKNYLHIHQHEEFSFIYRLKNARGQYEWYRDTGKVVEFNSAGFATKVVGTYSNITSSRYGEELNEIYIEAIENTNDWVTIINAKKQTAVANESLRKAYGLADEEFYFTPEKFGLNAEKSNYYRKLFAELAPGSNLRVEDRLFLKDGTPIDVSFKISTHTNKYSKDLYFVCIASDITEQKRNAKQLEKLANYDNLTGLVNRKFYLEKITSTIDEAKNNNLSFAILFIDLDKFKLVNDSFGHDVGDQLLITVSQRIQSVISSEDTLARIGGDEFVLLLKHASDISTIEHVVSDVIDAIEEPMDINTYKLRVSASIGVAMYPTLQCNAKELLANADAAMYFAKKDNKFKFKIYNEDMNLMARKQVVLEADIKNALANNKFFNLYQPIVHGANREICGCELLLRWSDDQGKIIVPNEFIPDAEKLGLIKPMTVAAMERGAKDLAQWRQINHDLYLTINISANHFTDDSFIPLLLRILAEHDLPPSAIKLEVTETALINEPEKAIAAMKQINELGIDIALDDFGTGFSSLNYLRNLPIKIIKIDRAFINGMHKNDTDEIIVDTTLFLAEKFGLHCIAEGVETYEQEQALLNKGCSQMQGFLFSKPISKDEISSLLINTTSVHTSACAY